MFSQAFKARRFPGDRRYRAGRVVFYARSIEHARQRIRGAGAPCLASSVQVAR